MCDLSSDACGSLWPVKRFLAGRSVAAQSFLSRQPVRTFFPGPAYGSNFSISPGSSAAELTQSRGAWWW